MSFITFSHVAWPPSRAWAGGGARTGLGTALKRVDWVTDLNRLPLNVVSSLSIIPAALETCAPSPRLQSPTRTAGGKDRGSWFWGQNLRVKEALPPSPLLPRTTGHSCPQLPFSRYVSGICPLSPTPCHQSSPSYGSSMVRRWQPRTSASPMAS